MTTTVESLELACRRKLKFCSAEVEAALLERHEAGGGKETGPKTSETTYEIMQTTATH